MDYKIVFSDADGTMLDSSHHMQPGTKYAVRELEKAGIPFVIVSGRYPGGIYVIQEEGNIKGPVIAYSGALILDENRNVLYSRGFSPEIAKEIMDFLDQSPWFCTWNLFAGDSWLGKDLSDYWVKEEEEIINNKAQMGDTSSLPDGVQIHKILCMCRPEDICEIERQIKNMYPDLSVVKSSDTHLEIMQHGISKSAAIQELCKIMKIPMEATIAFGDHFNDQEMLETAALSFLMDNAPAELKKIIPNHTAGNNEEGIYKALTGIGLIPEQKL